MTKVCELWGLVWSEHNSPLFLDGDEEGDDEEGEEDDGEGEGEEEEGEEEGEGDE